MNVYKWKTGLLPYEGRVPNMNYPDETGAYTNIKGRWKGYYYEPENDYIRHMGIFTEIKDVLELYDGGWEKNIDKRHERYLKKNIIVLKITTHDHVKTGK